MRRLTLDAMVPPLSLLPLVDAPEEEPSAVALASPLSPKSKLACEDGGGRAAGQGRRLKPQA